MIKSDIWDAFELVLVIWSPRTHYNGVSDVWWVFPDIIVRSIVLTQQIFDWGPKGNPGLKEGGMGFFLAQTRSSTLYNSSWTEWTFSPQAIWLFRANVGHASSGLMSSSSHTLEKSISLKQLCSTRVSSISLRRR